MKHFENNSAFCRNISNGKHRRARAAVALLLALVLLPVWAVSAGADDSCDCGYDPFVILHGTTLPPVRTNPDGTRTELFADGDYVSRIIETALPDAFLGLTTGYWDPYCEKVLDIILPAFDGFAPSTDGVLPEGTDIGWSWNENTIISDHSYGMDVANNYILEARWSMRADAADINNYIETVKRKTGHDTVEIITRCEGCSATLAYLWQYARPNNYAGIDSVVLGDPGFFGVNYVQDLFSGTVRIDGDCVYRYLKSSDLSGYFEDDMLRAVQQIIDALQKTYGLKITAEVANRAYSQLKDKLFAPILRAYYARQGGNWSFVYGKFDQAMEYLFPTEELKAEYAPIIEEVRWFHENVQSNAALIIREMMEAGVRVEIDAEYGFPQYPLSEDSAEIGDMLTGVKYKSLGATVSDIDGTLSDKYIAERKAAGFGAYISPDRQIDASTCLFPENTWFFKNINHIWTPQLRQHYVEFCRHEFDDVFSSPDHPQFLIYDPDEPTLIPLTADNDITPDFSAPLNILQKIVKFFRELFEKIKAALSFQR